MLPIETKVLNAYTIGDVVFSSSWHDSSGDEIWISVRFAGYSQAGALFFQWRRGSNSAGPGALRIPRPVQEMRVEIGPLGDNHPVATWRQGPGDDDIETVFYALGNLGELLEIEPEANEQVQTRDYGFRQASD